MIEKRLDQREAICKLIKKSIDDLSTHIHRLTDEDVKTYQMLQEPDSLLNDCPLSPFFVYHFIQQYMMKKDMDFIGAYVPDGKVNVKDFFKAAIEGHPWVMRFAKMKPKKKTGIEAIVKNSKNLEKSENISDLI